MTVKEPWREQYANKNSQEFKELAQQLGTAINELYENVPGVQFANIINLQ